MQKLSRRQIRRVILQESSAISEAPMQQPPEVIQKHLLDLQDAVRELAKHSGASSQVNLHSVLSDLCDHLKLNDSQKKAVLAAAWGR